MVMEFQRLSSNLISVIDEVLKNQQLVNLIGYDGDNPSKNNIPARTIAPKGVKERVFPYPFDVTYKKDVRSQLHIYYPRITFHNNGNASKVGILFDIVVHKNIWLLMEDDMKIVRPYQIAKYILDSFKDKRIKGVGEIHFVEANHTVINNEFEGFRLVAQFTEF